MLKEVSAFTQKAVDALMVRLHWMGVPKSQVFYCVGLMQAGCMSAATMTTLLGVPLWGQPLVGLFGFGISVAIYFVSKSERKTDQLAEERNALSPRDQPAEPAMLLLYGWMSIVWIVSAFVGLSSWGMAGFYILIWFRAKAKSSPRYPKPPAQRFTVPVHAS